MEWQYHINLEAVVQRFSVEKVFLKISQNSQEMPVSFLTKLQDWALLKKDTLIHVFSCEFCEVFKNTFFYRAPLAATSVNFRYRD